MRKLTKDELSAIQDLEDSPLIEQWSIDGHSNSLRRVTILSKVNADWNSVDALINSIFPDSEYRGKAGVSVISGIISEYFSIDVEGETLVNLCMKKTTLAGAVEGKTYQDHSNIVGAYVELLGPCECNQ